MKTTITPYVRPDGIIVGIKGEAPDKPECEVYKYDPNSKIDAESCDTSITCPCSLYEYDLLTFIQSGHAFEDQEWAFLLCCNPMKDVTPGLLPPIELDVEEVRQCCLNGSSIWDDSFADDKSVKVFELNGFKYRTVLRIAKEEVKPEEATETQEELWDEVYNNGILWYRQELIHEYLLKQFTIQRKTK